MADEIETIRVIVEDDQEHTIQQKRLEQIYQARKTVKSAINGVVEEQVTGAMPEQQARTVIRRAVESYALEAKWLIKQRDDKVDAKSYWKERSLGEQTLPNGEIVAFEGLRDFVTAPEYLTYQTNNQREGSLQGYQIESETKQVQISRQISMEAYDCVNQFLAEVNLDLTLAKDDGDAEWSTEETAKVGEPIEKEFVEQLETES